MSSVCKKIKLNETLKWKPILGDEYSKINFTFKKFLIADIKDNKKISHLVDKLHELYPISKYEPKFKRIRRQNEIKKSQVIICEKDLFTGLNKDLEENLDKMTEVDLPVDEILTRKQFELVSKNYWPINFHINKHIESLLDNSFLQNEKEILKHDLYARLILDICEFKKSKSAALIVDPRSDIIIASGVDNRLNHPLQHSVITAIGNVAKRQIKEMKNLDENYQDPLDEFIKFKFKDDEECLIQKNYTKKLNESDYLSTNYYAYLTHEPCSMCAMALIHSRISKVFFIFNTKFGYLNSKFKLHCHSALNHNYESYEAVDFKSECKSYFLNQDTKHPELLIK